MYWSCCLVDHFSLISIVFYIRIGSVLKYSFIVNFRQFPSFSIFSLLTFFLVGNPSVAILLFISTIFRFQLSSHPSDAASQSLLLFYILFLTLFVYFFTLWSPFCDPVCKAYFVTVIASCTFRVYQHDSRSLIPSRLRHMYSYRA